MAGISDNHQRLCFSVGLWNGQDPILKERLFGLTNGQGNHGEDVKELYYYLDNVPSHSYMKYLYKYPHAAYPYQQLVDENARRGKNQPEYEITDTGVFNGNNYFDVTVEYAKDGENEEDISIKITAKNRSLDQTRRLYVVPTLWFRNTWSWGEAKTLSDNEAKKLRDAKRPEMRLQKQISSKFQTVEATSGDLGSRYLYCQSENLDGDVLFCENETNFQKIWGVPNQTEYVKDGINDYIIHKDKKSVNPRQVGTKASPVYAMTLTPTSKVEIRLRLTNKKDLAEPFSGFDARFDARKMETDEFYQTISPEKAHSDMRNVQRQAFAGMLWSKQYYHYSLQQWFEGDSKFPPQPKERKLNSKNKDWVHCHMEDVLSMPDKWEYPFFAAWDLAFHTIPLAIIDPEFAKRQLLLLTREWYMHPNGQIPAYEWAFGDVNPPVHAWAAYRVFKIESRIYGRKDYLFLERVFQKLLLNFTWWVNRKDQDGLNVFEGGFLGLDNIGVFNRSEPLPTGGRLRQADGTSWMAMYCLNMLDIALALALVKPAYEDIASKFFEHFLFISDAMTYYNEGTKTAQSLWCEEDGFYYDLMVMPDGSSHHLRVRSLVGLIPLYACLVLEPEVLEKLPEFRRRMEWFLHNRSDLTSRNIASMTTEGIGKRRLLSLVNRDRLQLIMQKMLDSDEFWSPFGIRSMSKHHAQHPYTYWVHGHEYRVDYVPAESNSHMFGGNSNWRGPIWIPTNFLLVESLLRFHHYFGDDVKFECPTGSGTWFSLKEIAEFIRLRLVGIFLDPNSCRSTVVADCSNTTITMTPTSMTSTFDIQTKLNFTAQEAAQFFNRGRRAVIPVQDHPFYAKHDARNHESDDTSDDTWCGSDVSDSKLVLFYEFFDSETGRGCGASHQLGWTGLVAQMIQQHLRMTTTK